MDPQEIAEEARASRCGEPTRLRDAPPTRLQRIRRLPASDPDRLLLEREPDRRLHGNDRAQGEGAPVRRPPAALRAGPGRAGTAAGAVARCPPGVGRAHGRRRARSAAGRLGGAEPVVAAGGGATGSLRRRRHPSGALLGRVRGMVMGMARRRVRSRRGFWSSDLLASGRKCGAGLGSGPGDGAEPCNVIPPGVPPFRTCGGSASVQPSSRRRAGRSRRPRGPGSAGRS